MSNPSPGTGMKSVVVASVTPSRRILAPRPVTRAAVAGGLGALDLTAILAAGMAWDTIGWAACVTALGAAAARCDAAGIITRPCASILTGKIMAKLARRIGRTMVPTWRPYLTGLSLSSKDAPPTR
jgi:hypothetical protein